MAKRAKRRVRRRLRMLSIKQQSQETKITKTIAKRMINQRSESIILFKSYKYLKSIDSFPKNSWVSFQAFQKFMGQRNP